MARLTERPQPGSTPPPRSPFLPPAPRPQLPPADRALQQRATAGLLLTMLSLIALIWGATPQRTVYVVAVALVVAVAGLALTISAVRAARRGGSRRPRGAVIGLILGGLLTLLCGGALIGFMLYSSQITRYISCSDAATTSAQQSACQTQFMNSIGAQFAPIRG